mmetsp:Transcript_15994/g.27245  ORF Transcript_15994/g.27245 Transcript_15994/m.27245 type:complete len:317 (-) Transcript_15994:103-1053(-)
MDSTVQQIKTNEDRCDRPLWLHAKALLESRMAAMSAVDAQAFKAFQVLAKEHEKMSDGARKAMLRRKRPVNTKNTHGVLKASTLTEATKRVRKSKEERSKQQQHKQQQGGQPTDSQSANDLQATATAHAAFAEASAAGALSDGGGLFTTQSVSSAEGQGQGQGQGQSGAQALTLGPSQDLNKVRRKEAAAAVAHEKGGLEKGGYHWGVCGSNAALEEHSNQPQHGDICRMADGGVYCPIGCEHVLGKPHCAANSGDLTPEPEPCRFRNISRAFHVRDQIRTQIVGGSAPNSEDSERQFERRKQAQKRRESHRTVDA